MKTIWTQIASGVAALLCAVGAAHADVIDFENLDTSGAPFAPLMTDGDYLIQGNYLVQAFDGNNTGSFNGSLVGQLMNGSMPTTCLDQTCAGGDSTNYVATLNNGLLEIVGTGNLVLSSFDAAFLPPSGVTLPSTTVALLGIEADRDDGTYAIGLFDLAGPDAATGATSFASFRAADARIVAGSGTLTSGNVVDLYAYAYYCGASSSCSFLSTDRGQFALDNVVINVPEPADWALMALGLGTTAAVLRRRRSSL